MPSFQSSPLGQWLADATPALDGFIAHSEAAVAAAARLSTAVAEAGRTARGGFEDLDGATAGLEAVGARATRAADQVERQARRAADAVEQGEARLTESLDRQQQTATRLDDLVQLARDARNQWDEELALQLEAVEAGVISLEEFLARWGEGVVRLDGDVTTIRDLLAGLDFRAPQQRLQDLLTDLRTGRAEIGDAISFLEAKAPQLAQVLLQVVQDFLDGKTTLARVADEVRRLEKLFGPDTGLTDLAEALYQRLADAGRDGRL